MASAGGIRLQGVCKAYTDGGTARPVLKGLDLEIEAGQSVAVCGPSGSGKSTLLNLLAGISAPDDGSIEVCVGDPSRWIAVHELSAAAAGRFRRRYVGYVFQFFNLVPTLTVRENVLLPLELNGLAADWPRSLERLEALHLGERLSAFPEVLSGGERQRVAIARALAHRPDVVLADEPTGNLDAANTGVVADLLFDEAKALGKTLVIATHNPDIAARADHQVNLV